MRPQPQPKSSPTLSRKLALGVADEDVPVVRDCRCGRGGSRRSSGRRSSRSDAAASAVYGFGGLDGHWGYLRVRAAATARRRCGTKADGYSTASRAQLRRRVSDGGCGRAGAPTRAPRRRPGRAAAGISLPSSSSASAWASAESSRVGHAGLARELEDALGDEALARRDDLRRAVARIAQRGRDLLLRGSGKAARPRPRARPRAPAAARRGARPPRSAARGPSRRARPRAARAAAAAAAGRDRCDPRSRRRRALRRAAPRCSSSAPSDGVCRTTRTEPSSGRSRPVGLVAAVRLDREHAPAGQRDRPAGERERGAQLVAVAALGQLGHDARRHAPPAGRSSATRRSTSWSPSRPTTCSRSLSPACRPSGSRARTTAPASESSPRPSGPAASTTRAATSAPTRSRIAAACVRGDRDGGRSAGCPRLNSDAPRPTTGATGRPRNRPMDRSLYIMASGMLTELARQDRIANDLANASTPGYKRTVATQHAFGDILLESRRNGAPRRRRRPRRRGGRQPRRPDAGRAPHDRGAARRRARRRRLLRRRDRERRALHARRPVPRRRERQARHGRRRHRARHERQADRRRHERQARRSHRRDGRGRRQGVGKLAIAALSNPAKVDGGFFTGGVSAAPAKDTAVRQGFLEQPNATAAETMVDMIESLRAFEADQRVLHAIDESLQRGIQAGGTDAGPKERWQPSDDAADTRAGTGWTAQAGAPQEDADCDLPPSPDRERCVRDGQRTSDRRLGAHRPGMAARRGRERHRERRHRRLQAVAHRLLRGARHERRRPRRRRSARRAAAGALAAERQPALDRASTAPASSRFAPPTADRAHPRRRPPHRRRAQRSSPRAARRSTRRSRSRTTSSAARRLDRARRHRHRRRPQARPAHARRRARARRRSRPRSDGLLTPTAASGAADAEHDRRELQQGVLEQSNVDLATAMTDMIDAQRRFQLASRALHTQDQLLEIANGIRR